MSIHTYLFTTACVALAACYTASIDVTAPGTEVDRLALVAGTPSAFTRDTAQVTVGDTLRVSFVPLTSSNVAVRGVTLRWTTAEPTVVAIPGPSDQEAWSNVLLVARSPGSAHVRAETTNARTRSGQPLAWNGVVVVRATAASDAP